MPYKDPAVAKRKNHERYLRNRQKVLAQSAKYYREHQAEQSANRKRWRQNHQEKMREYGAKWRSTHPEANLARIRDYKEKMKNLVFDHYGRACKCCGESRPQFLSMDHIHGGGNKHRRESRLTNSTDLFLWIVRHGFPSTFQVLCHNCNLAKGFYGRCPHEIERGENQTLLPIAPSPLPQPENQDRFAFPS